MRMRISIKYDKIIMKLQHTRMRRGKLKQKSRFLIFKHGHSNLISYYTVEKNTNKERQ